MQFVLRMHLHSSTEHIVFRYHTAQVQGGINGKLLKTVHFLLTDRDVFFQSDLFKKEIKKENSENWSFQMMVQHF